MKTLLFLGLAFCLIVLGFVSGRMTAPATTEIRLPDNITPVIVADINDDHKDDFVFDNNGEFTAFFSGDDNKFAVEKILISSAYNEPADCMELLIFINGDVYSVLVKDQNNPLLEAANNYTYAWR